VLFSRGFVGIFGGAALQPYDYWPFWFVSGYGFSRTAQALNEDGL
jgi:hypothetical protein